MQLLAVKASHKWNDSGAIELQPSGIMYRFRVFKEFPREGLAQSSVCSLIHQRIEEKEKEDIDRIQGVIDFITTSGCLSRGLVRHFGDESSVPQDRCGSCQYCLTGVAVQFVNSEPVKKSNTGLKYRFLLSYYRMREVRLPIVYKASGQFTINGCLKHTGTRSLASFKEPNSPRQSDLDSS
jgi:hypothetical protein